MRRKADAASQVARRWFFVTLALALGLMVVGIAIEVSLSIAVLGPVRQLTAATTRVAAGELDTAVPVRSREPIRTLRGRPSLKEWPTISVLVTMTDG